MTSINWEEFDRHQAPYEGRIASQYKVPAGKDLDVLIERLKANPNGIVLDQKAVAMLFSIPQEDLPRPRSIVQSVRKKMNRVGIGVGLVGADKEGKGGKIRLRPKPQR